MKELFIMLAADAETDAERVVYLALAEEPPTPGENVVLEFADDRAVIKREAA